MSMTVNIDPDTGLPELPEGYYWDVKAYQIAIMRTVVTDWYPVQSYTSYYASRFVEDDAKYIGEDTETRDVEYEYSQSTWWGGTRVKTGTRKEVRFFIHYRPAVRYYKDGDTEVQYDDTMCNYGETQRTYVGGGPITRDNILTRAASLYRSWIDEQERKKLYGKYPPKSLT